MGSLGQGRFWVRDSSFIVSNGKVREGAERINPPENTVLEEKIRVPRTKIWGMGKY